MPDPAPHTPQLVRWLERVRAGDLVAREELLRAVCGRLEQLARQMLRRFPSVRRWAETGDVLSGAVLRLLRALQEVRPASERDFFGLAAVQVRRELLDLARRFRGAHGLEPNHASHPVADDALASEDGPTDRGDDPNDLERWCAFHQEVEKLPAEEREVVSLVYYHGWTQAQVAEMFQVAERTVRRRWQTALAKLHAVLKDEANEA